MVWAILIAFVAGVIVGVSFTLYAIRRSKRTDIISTPIKTVLIISAISLVSIIGVMLIAPDIITDPPTEIWCEPPLKNYNSVCSCGPEMELTKEPGGLLICSPMNT